MAGSLVWLIPSLIGLFLWGIGQGFLKQWSQEVPPALFCLYLFVAKSIVNLGYFLYLGTGNPFSMESNSFLIAALIAYIFDGLGWILYFQSIIYGPITIVGTLSAAFPALTILFARVFLHENLSTIQYVGVGAVIVGCLGLSYSPADPEEEADSRIQHKKWIPLATFALISWGLAQTIVKYASGISTIKDPSGNLALFNIIGGGLTLGLFGLTRGLKDLTSIKDALKYQSYLPTFMMAGGDLMVIIASTRGPISIISPLTGAYPLVTLMYAATILKEKITSLQWICIIFLLFGIYFTTN